MTLIFIASIAAPLVEAVWREDLLSSEVERRVFSSLPEMPSTIDEVQKYPEAYAAYYSDHFGFRPKLTKIYFRLTRFIERVGFGGDQSTRGATIGKDGWLFLGSDRPGDTNHSNVMADAMNISLYSDVDLETMVGNLRIIDDWLAARDIDFVLMVAPNKHTIYFDKLPDRITKKGPLSSTDQLLNRVREATGIHIVDARAPMIAAKDSAQLYFKGDTHWNSRGANVAQFELFKVLNDVFPGRVKAELLPADRFSAETYFEQPDLYAFLGLPPVREVSPEPVFDSGCDPVRADAERSEGDFILATCDTAELKAIIFRDSFFGSLMPYVSRQFAQTIYIWGLFDSRPAERMLDSEMLRRYVEAEHPDVVVLEFVERHLPFVLDTPVAIMDGYQ